MTTRHQLAAVLVFCSILGVISATQAEPPLDALGKQYLTQARQLIRATEFEQAWIQLNWAKQYFEEHGDIDGHIETLIATADYYANSGGGQQAHQALDQAKALAREQQRPLLLAAALRQSAQYLAGDQNFVAAWQALDDARVIFGELELHEKLLELDAFASLLASRQGDHQKAAELAAAAIPPLQAAGNQRMEMNALAVLAYSQQRLGDYPAALMSYQSLIPKAWALNDQLQLNSAYCTIAEVKRQLGMDTAAESDLRHAIESLSKARQRLPRTPQERSIFVEQQILAFSRLAELLVDSYRSDEALDLIEQFRAQAFFDNLALVEVSRQHDIEPSLRSREQALLRALAEAQLANAELRPTQPIDDLEADIQTLRADYWQRHGIAPAVARQGVSINKIQALLAVDEAAISYWTLADRVLAWVITNEKVEFANIPVSETDLHNAVTQFVAPLKWPWLARDQAISGNEQQHIQTGSKLYRWLIDSLPGTAHSAARWIIIPDGIMNALPWSALIRDCAATADDQNRIHGIYSGCHYLIEEHTLRYSSSLSALVQLRQRNLQQTEVREDSALVLAPNFDAYDKLQLAPLPAAVREVKHLEQWFDHTQRLLGDDASEARFKQQAGQFKIIHLATHGLIEENYPLSSGVLLNPGEQDDGLLQAHEVLALKLDANLVTLAACRSADGKFSRAEGLVGLSQAFLYAGADTVLASIWDLQDAHSATLLQPFYQSRHTGLGNDQALREAQLGMLHSQGMELLVTQPVLTSFAHPRFWAGYRLIGAP